MKFFFGPAPGKMGFVTHRSTESHHLLLSVGLTVCTSPHQNPTRAVSSPNATRYLAPALPRPAPPSPAQPPGPALRASFPPDSQQTLCLSASAPPAWPCCYSEGPTSQAGPSRHAVGAICPTAPGASPSAGSLCPVSCVSGCPAACRPQARPSEKGSAQFHSMFSSVPSDGVSTTP